MSVRKRKWTTASGAEKEAWIVDYVDQEGVRRLKTFQRKKEAEAWKDATSLEVREGTHVADSATVTVKEAGGMWMDSAKAAGLERTTVDQYRQHLDLHIAPFLGAMKLSQVSVPIVRKFQDRLRTEGRSPAMVKRATVSLGGILADAQERGLVARNAVREMTKRRGKGRVGQAERRQSARLQVGVDIPTAAEITAMIDSVRGRWRPLIITAIFTGMRASELRGLRWADVDLKAGRLHVRQRADRYNEIGMPKSEAGQRSIPVPPMVTNTLREWKLVCPASKADFVFPNGLGNAESHANIINRGLVPLQLAAGIVTTEGAAKYTGLHALRHFYASWCINRSKDGGVGLPPKMVQERLGHSSLAMTMDVYGHLFPSDDLADELAAAERSLFAVAANAT